MPKVYFINIDIVRAKRFNEIIEYFFKTNNNKIKVKLASILANMMQNEPYVQEAAIDHGIYEEVFKILGDQNADLTLIKKTIYLLTGLIFGQSFKSKNLILENSKNNQLINYFLNDLNENERKLDNSSYLRLLNILGELSRLEEKGSECYEIRFNFLQIVKENEFSKFYLKLLQNYNINKENFDNRVEILKRLLQFLLNIAPVYAQNEVQTNFIHLIKSLGENNLIHVGQLQELTNIYNDSIKELKEINEAAATNPNINEEIQIETNKGMIRLVLKPEDL